MRRSFTLRSVAALLLLCGADHALAQQTTTTTFTVTATARGNCLVAATDLAFGDYTPGAGAVDAQSTITVRCTNGTAYSVALNGGTTAGGNIVQRLLANGADTLQYNLFTDAARTTLWGDGTTGARPAGSGTGLSPANAQTRTVYGRVPDSATNQDAPPGNYSDVVTVTVEF